MMTSTDRASAALRRVFEIAARVLRGLTLLAIGSAGAVAVAWLVWVADAPPPATDGWVARLVVLAVLLSPAAVLLVLVAGLRDLGRLPERTRALPSDLRDRASDVRRPPSGSPRRGILGVLVSMIRLARVVLGSREALSPYAAVTIALRPAILLASFLAALAAVVEIPAAVVSVLILALTCRSGSAGGSHRPRRPNRGSTRPWGAAAPSRSRGSRRSR